MTAASPADHPETLFAYVGCYTTKERNGRGDGLGVYRMDPGSGDWTQVQLVQELVNPSFLTHDRHRRHLYVAHGDGEYATALDIDRKTGQLAVLNQQATGGKNGVSLAVDPTDRFVVVANYGSGTVAVLPIDPNGSLALPSDLVTLTGTPGPHRTQQTSSHPHDVRFDAHGRFIAVPDKGLDKTFVFALDPVRGKLVAADPPSVSARPGAAPRHVAFHPTRSCAYVINELDSTITTYRLDPERGALVPLQVIPTLPSPARVASSMGRTAARAPSRSSPSTRPPGCSRRSAGSRRRASDRASSRSTPPGRFSMPRTRTATRSSASASTLPRGS